MTKKIGDKIVTDKGSYTVQKIINYKGHAIAVEIGIRKGIPTTHYVVVTSNTMEMLCDSLPEAEELVDTLRARLKD